MIRTKVQLLIPLLAALSFACAGGKGDVKVQGPRVAAQGQPAANGAQPPKDANGKAPTEIVPQVSARAKLYFEDALKAYDAQKKAGKFEYGSLEAKFQKAADEDPKFGEAYYNLGVLAERQNKVDQAVDFYKKALAVKPTLRQAAENLAVIRQNKGDTAGAVEIYQQILTVYPEDASSRARLAEIYRQQGDIDRAVEFARQALMRDPKTLAAYKVMMLANLERKQLSMAKLVALRALKLDENDPELYYTIGLILLKENDPTKARVQFAKAAEVRPDYQPAQVMLAKVALQEEDYTGAEEHLRRILQADGKNAEALLDLGIAYKGQGQYDKAMAAYDAAEKVNPNLAAVWFNRGVILAEQKGQMEKGLEYYNKYIAMAGGDAAVGDHPVRAAIERAKAKIAKREEDKRLAEQKAEEEKKAIEEAKKMEEEAKKAEEEARAAEEAKKNGGKPPAKDGKAAPDAKNEVKPAAGTDGAGDVKPATDKKPEKKEEKKAEEPKPAAPAKAAPAAAPEKKGEPGEEPSDGL